jgi:BirA family transcriptional regulator, biotin operon repressor / biotin---[acetyl-CoA-carboxylase] ligase
MGRFNDLRRFAEIDSTNRWVAEQARGGAADGLVAVAEMQSAGRGRLDRTWIAPAGSALLCTVLVRPRMPMSRWHWLNLAMAVAAQDAIRLLGESSKGEGSQTRGIGRSIATQSNSYGADTESGVDPDERQADSVDVFKVAVKWPNDLIVPAMGDRKLAGILAEMVLPANGEGAVAVGIGLNVRRPLDVDPEVAVRGVWLDEIVNAHTNYSTDRPDDDFGNRQSSVDRSSRSGPTKSPSVDEVLTVLLVEFERQVAEVEDHPDAFLAKYRQRCITVGRQVRAMLPSSDIVGTASGIDIDGQLLVTTEDGTTHTISAADVIHIRPAT